MKLISAFIWLFVLSAALFVQVSHSITTDSPATWLLLHNLARAKLNLIPLVWNQTLADFAKNYAESRSGDCELIHSDSPYGENLYWGEGLGALGAVNAVKGWVDEEIGFYDYDKNECIGGQQCLHYTQVVWSTTTSVGCGVADCKGVPNKEIISCNYFPPGNYIGERPY